MRNKMLHLNTQLLTTEKAKEVVEEIREHIDQENFEELFEYKKFVKDKNENDRLAIDIEQFIENYITRFIHDNNIFIDTYKFYKKGEYNEEIEFYHSNERSDIKQEVHFFMIKYLRTFTFIEGGYTKKINAFFSYLKEVILKGITIYLDNTYNYKSEDYHELKVVPIDNNYNLDTGIDYYSINLSTEDKFFKRVERSRNKEVIDSFLSGLDERDRIIYRQNRILDLRTQKQLAEKFGVSQQAISKKVNKFDKLLAEVFIAEWGGISYSA